MLRGLGGQPLGDLVGEVLDGQRVLGLVASEDVLCASLTGHPRPGLGHVVLLEDALLAPLLPRHPGGVREGRREGLQQPPAVQVPFETGHRGLPRVVAARLVEDLDEDLKEGIGLVLVDQRSLLIDVEQQGGRRDARGPCQQAAEHGVTLRLGGERLGRVPSLTRATGNVPEEVGEHLQQVRLT